MFGYVIPDRAGLSPEAQSRYRSAYCGLCRRIDALHGLRGRFSLSYDLTFLNILLCSLYEGETPADSGIDRCPVHPVHGVLWRSADPTDYCADLSVALHYYNAQDKWQDDHNLLALGYSTLLDNSTAEAARVQAESPVVDRWNEYMKDVMLMEMDPETGAQPLMKQVFFFD